jgi:hypothetical protein
MEQTYYMYHSINSTQKCVNPVGPGEEMFRVFISSDHANACVWWGGVGWNAWRMICSKQSSQ